MSPSFKRLKMSTTPSNLFELVRQADNGSYLIDMEDGEVKEFIEGVFGERFGCHDQKNMKEYFENQPYVISENSQILKYSECSMNNKDTEDSEINKDSECQGNLKDTKQTKIKKDSEFFGNINDIANPESSGNVKEFEYSGSIDYHSTIEDLKYPETNIHNTDSKNKDIQIGNDDLPRIKRSYIGYVKPSSGYDWLDDIGINEEDFLSLFYHSYELDDNDKKGSVESKGNERSRYFLDTRICYKCGKIGHIDIKCPDRVKQLCILCGCIDHSKYNCLLIICSNCNKHGHRYRNCREMFDTKQKFRFCDRCPNRHTVRDCPLSWRRYKYYNPENIAINMSCSFCLGDDHFIDDCNIRKSKNSIFTEKYEEMLRGRNNHFRRNSYR